MINLAGVEEADEHIKVELYMAGIELIQGEKSGGEVPYSITGKLGYWKFERAWYYWVASAEKSRGLPLEVAAKMHERKYPIVGERQPKKYGQIIRVAGDCSCPHPTKSVIHYDADGIELVLDPNGEQETKINYFIEKRLLKPDDKEGIRFVKSLDGLVAKSVADLYHIDNQIGLNEFARVVKEL